MSGRRGVVLAIGILLTAMAGCASSLGRYESRAQRIAHGRLGSRPTIAGSAEISGTSEALAPEVRRLLAGPLSSDDVVRIALANNRDLVAAFGELGVSRAALLAAAVPSGPALEEAAVRFATDGHGDPAFELGVMQDLTDLVLLPAARAAADAEAEAATLSAARAALDVAFDARRAYVAYVASEQDLARAREVLEGAEAAALAARALHEAGNVPAVDAQTEEAFAEDVRASMWRARDAVLVARERLNVLMGLTGRATRWTSPTSLGGPPGDAQDRARTAHLPHRAVDRSLDLAVSRLRILAAARRLRLRRAETLVPEIAVGVSVAREDEHWSVGPALSLELPFFGPRTGEWASARAELARLRAGHVALGVRVESAARATSARLAGTRERAVHARDVLVPLRRAIVGERLREYNAMQIGVFALLDAQRAYVEAERRATAELRDYWLARVDLEQLAAGRLPDEAGAASGVESAGEGPARGGH
ncbi:MAG: TolC family protein [Deltaproteobacteria bacterium]|nr:TolC family protein [Deltaproteobacteria bacterium]